jgi:Arc/MetJ-type ribon-helix-helix transcriptional regulator
MTRKPRAYVAALPLSALPELRECLAPFLGKEDRRGHVVMMRLADQGVKCLDDLVEAGLFGSRSEAAAFLVGAGIQSQKELFDNISRYSSEIKKIRRDLRRTALKSLQTAAARKRPRRKR